MHVHVTRSRIRPARDAPSDTIILLLYTASILRHTSNDSHMLHGHGQKDASIRSWFVSSHKTISDSTCNYGTDHTAL